MLACWISPRRLHSQLNRTSCFASSGQISLVTTFDDWTLDGLDGDLSRNRFRWLGASSRHVTFDVKGKTEINSLLFSPTIIPPRNFLAIPGIFSIVYDS